MKIIRYFIVKRQRFLEILILFLFEVIIEGPVKGMKNLSEIFSKIVAIVI
ncbi:hypothetical protein HMPREF0204_13580 [Chryseobacterium gleum ATCC 35910]|uniref:Uncharacterized protein n=1 Tax=Chryseobacterium gleum ATCC 35910 TaxID=525257 RepID=A0ABN0AN51_CHRGE|nr:hypothetical protein HMPREF0204_13580 [Chryseobacterium gleum ATCC 35910]